MVQKFYIIAQSRVYLNETVEKLVVAGFGSTSASTKLSTLRSILSNVEGLTISQNIPSEVEG